MRLSYFQKLMTNIMIWRKDQTVFRKYYILLSENKIKNINHIQQQIMISRKYKTKNTKVGNMCIFCHNKFLKKSSRVSFHEKQKTADINNYPLYGHFFLKKNYDYYLGNFFWMPFLRLTNNWICILRDDSSMNCCNTLQF